MLIIERMFQLPIGTDIKAIPNTTYRNEAIIKAVYFYSDSSVAGLRQVNSPNGTSWTNVSFQQYNEEGEKGFKLLKRIDNMLPWMFEKIYDMSSSRIEKTQLTLVFNDNRQCFIDQYRDANDGLILATMEMEADAIPPAFMGMEITDRSLFFSESFLASHPVRDWTEELEIKYGFK